MISWYFWEIQRYTWRPRPPRYGERLTKRPGPEESLHQESSWKSTGHLASFMIFHVDEQAAFLTFGGWCFPYEVNISDSNGRFDELSKRWLHWRFSDSNWSERKRVIQNHQNRWTSFVEHLTLYIDLHHSAMAAMCSYVNFTQVIHDPPDLPWVGCRFWCFWPSQEAKFKKLKLENKVWPTKIPWRIDSVVPSNLMV